MLSEIGYRLYRGVVSVLMPVILSLIYILGIGMTAVYVRLFHRRLVSGPSKKRKTFWKEAAGYSSDMSENLSGS
jgi:hypothetical protein